MRKYLAILVLFSLVFALVLSTNTTTTQAQTYPAWAPNVAYAVGAMVTYQDATHPNHLYKCIQAHTSQVGWEPPNVPALWSDQGAYSGGSSTATSVPPTTAPTKTNTPVSATSTTAPTKTNTP